MYAYTLIERENERNNKISSKNYLTPAYVSNDRKSKSCISVTVISPSSSTWLSKYNQTDTSLLMSTRPNDQEYVVPDFMVPALHHLFDGHQKKIDLDAFSLAGAVSTSHPHFFSSFAPMKFMGQWESAHHPNECEYPFDQCQSLCHQPHH